ncbi:hypothetical protein [Metallibacterium scheffleri]|uniref:Uncharacterized protein n=1 Tax=Metallibacterium scheffleri TaxID=993689 RepID=A0A4S3KPR3_9GAMM|nr:hypothetical protein [Metallibacterium scheffleri]THD10995.1 hypothetical protein B1806_05510 [Metallibacterium scheffleri]
MSWYVSTTFWTGAAAVFTAVMAGFTGWSVVASQRQQRRALQQSEQHHQDGFRPVLVLAPSDDAIPLDRSKLLKLVPTNSGATERTYIIACLLTNIGVGPALNVHLLLRMRGIDGYGISRELTPVSAGLLGSRGESDGSIRVTFKPHDGFNDVDVQLSTGDPWELLLEYEDVFGNRFHTIHSKIPLQPWTVCGKGPAPLGVDPAVANERLRATSAGLSDHRDDTGYP